MIARTLVLALGTAVFVAVVSISQGGRPVTPSTSFATSGALWADLDCSGDITTADPLQALLEIGGLSGDTAEFCPFFGTPVEADGVDRVFGDVNCDGVANARDAVELLAEVAGIGATTGDCPDVGAAVDLTVLAVISEVGEDWRDYGDAPEGGPTLYAGGAVIGSFPTSEAAGPSHEAPFAFRLGEFESAEETPSANDSADDGLLWLEMDECDTSSALIAVSLDGVPEGERDELTVNIFADWNKDGDWDDADGCTDEWALQNFALDVSGEPDFTILAVDFPGGDQVDEFWMRVTLTDQAYDPATGNLLPGETEDYLISGGQVFQPDEPAQPSGPGKTAFPDFDCKGSVIPHGTKTIVFEFLQTTASFGSGFRVLRFDPDMTQPTTADGMRADGVFASRITSKLDKLDGLLRVRLTVTIATTEDGPDRLQGPLVILIAYGGQQQNGDAFIDFRECAFYVDHKTGAAFQDPDTAGFYGGPGRAFGKRSFEGEVLYLLHGKTRGFKSDAAVSPKDFTGTLYDKSSVTVYGSNGAVLMGADLETATGVSSVTVASNGRVVKIKTVRDDHEPPVVPIVVRVMGTAPNGDTVWDYFRVFIVHERGTKAKKLLGALIESADFAFRFDEDEATTIAYVQDGNALLSHEAPLETYLFDDTEVICVAGGGQAVRHPFHSSFGVSSYGFILDYAGGPGSDVFYIPSSNQVSRNVSGALPCPPLSAVNVTNFGSSSPFFIFEATGCGDKIIFSELDVELGTFQLGAVGLDGSSLAPVSGGDSYRDPSCFTYDGQMGIVGSTPGAEGRSEGGYVPLFECNATCTESLPASKVILPADAPNVHMLGLAVSPDAMKIAWYRSVPGDSQVWVGDFDPFTQTVSNHQQLTTEGFNYDPTWSPDGSQIAFLSGRDGNLEIYVMFADGSDQTNITNTPDADETEPSWQVP